MMGRRKNGTRNGQPLDWIIAVAAESPDGECRDWPFGRYDDGYPCYRGRASHEMLRRVGRPRPPAPLDQAMHSCDRPICLAPWHLRWGTVSENTREAYERGLALAARGESHGLAKLTTESVRVIRATYAAGGTSHSALARQFGVARSQIQNVLHRRTWREVE